MTADADALALHADAVLALLRRAPGSPELVVCDGVVQAGVVAPYVLVYFSDRTPEAAEAPDTASLSGPNLRQITTIYAHCVGATAAAARAVRGRVRAALQDVTPTIEGRSCWPIRATEDLPPDRDETTGPLVMDLICLYRLESIPA